MTASSELRPTNLHKFNLMQSPIAYILIEHAYSAFRRWGAELGLGISYEAYMNDGISKESSKDAQEREMAQYIADMLLEMRNMARSAGLPTLLGLLELSFCEAFSIANKVEIPAGEIEKLKRLAKAARE